MESRCKKWIECNALFIDEQFENMGLEETSWERTFIDISNVIMFTAYEKYNIKASQLYIPGTPEIIIDISVDKLKEILTE